MVDKRFAWVGLSCFIMFVALLSLLWGSWIFSTPAWGQDTRLLDCLEVSFFGPGCAVAVPPESVAVPRSPTLADYPLFPPETLAPDTPPVFMQLLEDLNPATADLFLAWQAQRLQRMQAVQQLLKQRAQVRRGQP